MKKITALLLTLILVFSMSTAVFADTVYEDMETITITKYYNNPNNGVSPEETFIFEPVKVKVSEAGIDPTTGLVVTVDTMPALDSVSSVKFDEGDAGKVVIVDGVATYNCKKDIVVDLPEYKAVGIYEYKIKEKAGNMAGVTYQDSDIRLVVTVIEQNGKVRVAAVHTEDVGGEKNDTIVNVYHSGTLAVTKEVTGNMGDLEKEFTVKVTFTTPEGELVKAPITYVEDGVTKKIEPDETEKDGWTGTKEVTIQLKHGETIKFDNIPEGVTYEVVEDNYQSEGYKDAQYEFSDNSKLIDKVEGENDDTVKIINEKSAAVDTGIFTDSMPYVCILAVTVIGMFAITGKKRYEI